MIKEEVRQIIENKLKDLGIKDPVVEISYPRFTDLGTLSINAAFRYAKQLNTSAPLLASIIKEDLEGKNIKLIESVSVEAGFVNIEIVAQELFQQVQSSKPIKNEGKQILLEYGQPNTHKTPHIGHLYSYIFGESLARILENEGNVVKRLNYQGDIGLHVAKSLWGLTETYLAEYKVKPLKERVLFLQKSYQEGSQAYEKDKKAEKEIDDLNHKIYLHDKEIEHMWKETRQWCVDFYKEFEKRLGISYDKYYFESESGPVGKKIVQESVGKIFDESQGAVIFSGEKYELHTRVFINQRGNPTYEAKDIGLITLKIKDFKFDTSIVTTANEQSDYWKVVIKASELTYPKLQGKLKHLGFGMINLSSGKMSSRTGLIVNAFSLIDEVSEMIQKEYETTPENSQTIALAAIKYSFLRSDAYKNILFDLEKSIAKEGASGPYLLYTCVRIQSILSKADAGKAKAPSMITKEEKDLLKYLVRFNDIVKRASETFSPHLIAQYLYELSQLFNIFYQKHPVLKAEKDISAFRLTLTKHVGDVLKNGLYLLGIETVEKM